MGLSCCARSPTPFRHTVNMAVVFFQSVDLPKQFPALHDAHGNMGQKREQIAQAEGLVAEWRLDPAKSEAQITTAL